MKVLVTGAAGFIGAHTVRRLAERGHVPVALVRDPARAAHVLPADVRIVAADARDAGAVAAASAGCGAIVHCAALVGVEHYTQRPVETMETELDTLRAVCQAGLSAPDAKIIYVSSSAVYGNRSGPSPFDENLDAVGVTSYAISKRYNELYLDAQFREHGLQSVSLRVFNVYGPGQDHRLVIPRFIQRAIEGKPLLIYGTGDNIRDFVYVGDVVDVAVDCIEKVSGCHILNVASETPVSVRALAEAVITATGTKAEIHHEPLPAERSTHEVTWSVGSLARLRTLLGPRAMTDLGTGLRNTVAGMQLDLERR